MSLQAAIQAGYKPAGTSDAHCARCTHSRPSKAADSMRVCRKHEVTVHPRALCSQFTQAGRT